MLSLVVVAVCKVQAAGGRLLAAGVVECKVQVVGDCRLLAGAGH